MVGIIYFNTTVEGDIEFLSKQENIEVKGSNGTEVVNQFTSNSSQFVKNTTITALTVDTITYLGK